MIIIGGATATGKSEIAISLAERLNGEIISADSMQIYKEMNIGTAKITKNEMCGIKHYMIDIVEPNMEYSVAQFSAEAKNIIQSIKNNGKVPIIVGGTGLYINALIYDYKLCDRNEELRKALNDELIINGKTALYQKLCEIDPISAQNIHENNTKRVIRALEVKITSGHSIGEQNDRKNFNPHLMFASNLSRELLYDKINKRVDKMFDFGLLDEINYLIKDKNLKFDMQSMQAIGYKEFAAYFNNKISLDEVKSQIKQHTRNYAKRQETWFKAIPTCNMYDFSNKQLIIDKIEQEYYKNKDNLK